MNTHTLQYMLIKQTIQNVVQDIEDGEITGLQTLLATALKTEPQGYRHILNTIVS